MAVRVSKKLFKKLVRQGKVEWPVDEKGNRIPIEQLDPAVSVRKNKYNAKRTEKYGMKFDSHAELYCFEFLKIYLPRCCSIVKVERKDSILLADAIEITPDFHRTCKENPTHEEYHEYKGFETPAWNLKKTLWTKHGPCKLIVWMGRGKDLHIDETIIPEGK